MPYKPHRPHNEEGTEAWLMSYADMITLLLCFFIIFVSVSEPKEKFMAAAVEGMRAKFGSVNLANPFTAVYRGLEGVIDQNELYQDVAIEHTEKGMNMELATARFYQPGTAELNPAMLPVLAQMAGAFREAEFADYALAVEVHTDNAPPQNAKYADNWELSAARAASLTRFFATQNIKPERLRATGFAAAQPKVPNEAADGTPIEENRLRNQRVVVRFERVVGNRGP